jgi:cell division inhibitor SulA
MSRMSLGVFAASLGELQTGPRCQSQSRPSLVLWSSAALEERDVRVQAMVHHASKAFDLTINMAFASTISPRRCFTQPWTQVLLIPLLELLRRRSRTHLDFLSPSQSSQEPLPHSFDDSMMQMLGYTRLKTMVLRTLQPSGVLQNVTFATKSTRMSAYDWQGPSAWGTGVVSRIQHRRLPSRISS